MSNNSKVIQSKNIVMMLFGWFLILIIFAVPLGQSDVGEREFKDVHINMKADDIFSPEYEHDEEREAETRTVHADYSSPPGGGVKFNRNYTDVGRWTSEAIDGIINLQGSVEFNIWILELEDTDDTCEFEFTFEHNGESMAFVEITDQQLNSDEVTQISVTEDLNESIEAVRGDTLGVYIRYNGWNDIEVYYDNITYDSGAAVEMDPVILFQGNTPEMSKFHEAWGINANSNLKFFSSIEVEGSVLMGDQDTEIRGGSSEEGTDGATYSTTEIRFKGVDIQEGDHITITINYGPSESSEGWTYSFIHENPIVVEIRSISPDPALDTDTIHFSGYSSEEKILRFVWRSSRDGEFYNGTDYDFSFDDLTTGEHTIYFRVQSESGKWSGETTTKLTVHERPVAVITSVFSDPYLEGDEVQFSGYGEDDGDIDRYIWASSLDGELQNNAKCDFSSSILSPGEHIISLTVRDNNGVWSDEVWVNLTIQEYDGQLSSVPELSITSPMNNTMVSGTIMVVGTATDEDGDSTLDRVEYSINNGTWQAIAGTTLWSFQWDSTSVENGDYLIHVRSYDGENYSQVGSIFVTVTNNKGNDDGDGDDDTDVMAFIALSGVVLAGAIIGIFMFVQKSGDTDSVDCPDCGTDVHYFAEYDDWYCYNCEKYLDDD